MLHMHVQEPFLAPASSHESLPTSGAGLIDGIGDAAPEVVLSGRMTLEPWNTKLDCITHSTEMGEQVRFGRAIEGGVFRSGACARQSTWLPLPCRTDRVCTALPRKTLLPGDYSVA
jgi:hypothetical protein